MAHDGVGPGGGVTTLSVVVPVYSGAAYLERLVEGVEALRTRWRDEGAPVALAELILVDDNAVDESPRLIDALARDRRWVTPLHLARNYGQHAATIAGVLHSSGDWVVTMDEDLQHPPERIPDLLRRAGREGADVIYAQPETAVHGAAVRDWSSRGFKRAMEWLTGDPNLRYFNSFRLLRGAVARAAASVCTHDTYFDVNLSWYTRRVAVVPMPLVDERYQRTGRSGYSLRTLFSHAWRMLFSSHIRALRFSALFGAGVLGVSALGVAALVVSKIVAPEVAIAGWTSLMLAVTFFGGLIVFMLGVALQYLSTLALRAHGKPTFFAVDRSQDRTLAAFLTQAEDADADSGAARCGF